MADELADCGVELGRAAADVRPGGLDVVSGRPAGRRLVPGDYRAQALSLAADPGVVLRGGG